MFLSYIISVQTHWQEVGHVQSDRLVPSHEDDFGLWFCLAGGDGMLRRRQLACRVVGEHRTHSWGGGALHTGDHCRLHPLNRW